MRLELGLRGQNMLLDNIFLLDASPESTRMVRELFCKFSVFVNIEPTVIITIWVRGGQDSGQ